MSSVTLRGTPSPVPVSKIICVGRNYAAHAKEMKAEIPEQPVLFLKPPSAILHDGGTIVIPKISRDLHHEVEMTVLIGRGGKNIDEHSALSHVAGYGVGLDMTLRDVQSEAKKKGLPWTLAKGFDTSAPLSEFVPAAAIADPHALEVELRVNGAVRQRGNTSSFIFRLERLISLISTHFTLEKGDVIFTGTPEGVAQAVPGDTLEATLRTPGGTPLSLLTVRIGQA
ncbi:MAG: fumarylacetoacetate hydrolase family protein [Ignavibacterium sp.]|jgi:2-keto-4-pentenoate hydratase/2-oxohepta-3-ene-1,7-dioic acid hydratase in catechol pathway